MRTSAAAGTACWIFSLRSVPSNMAEISSSVRFRVSTIMKYRNPSSNAIQQIYTIYAHRHTDEYMLAGTSGGSGAGTHVVLPADVLQRDRVHVLVEDERDGDREVEHVEALGAQRERQDLDRVRHDERRERQAVGEVVR